LILILLFFGCNEKAPDVADFELNNETETNLMNKFGCNIGVDKTETLNELIALDCIKKQEFNGEEIYEIGAHPMGVWSVTYIF
jgi:hypothetical protein